MSAGFDPAREPVFRANLQALSRRDPELARRLCLPVAGGHVEPDPPVYLHHRTRYPLAVDPAEAVAAAPRQGKLFLFGVGLGEILRAVLEARPEAEVLAWDRDPWLLRLALAGGDLTGPLARGRLRLALGVDLASGLEEARAAWRIPHPLLARIYALEARLLEGETRQRRALIAAGGLFVDDLAEALAEEGFAVVPVELQRWAREELERAVRRTAPELICAVNYSHGLAEFARDLGLPLACWEVDPATDRLLPLEGPAPRAHVFTYRPAHVERFRRAGFESVRALPLASNTRRHRPLELDPRERERYGAPVCFVGASMVETARDHRRAFLEEYARWRGDARGAVEEGAAHLDAALTAQRADFSRPRLEEELARRLGGFLADMEERGSARDPLMLAAESAAAEKRLTYVANLAPFGIQVWGDEGWRALEPHGVRYRGPAGHARELPRVYNGARIQVDVGRLYQDDIATMRVFDVLACGGFLIAEHSTALEELFEIGRELESYRSLDELRAKVAHYLEHAEEARSIAEAGLAAVRERHDIRHRVRLMLDVALDAPAEGR